MFRSLRETGSSFAVGMTGISRASPAPPHPGSGRSTLNPGPPRPLRTCRRYCSMAPSPTSFSPVTSGSRQLPTSHSTGSTGSTRQFPTLYMRAKSFDILDVQVINTSLDSAVRPPARELLCQTEYLEDRLHRLESLAAVVRTVSAPDALPALAIRRTGQWPLPLLRGRPAHGSRVLGSAARHRAAPQRRPGAGLGCHPDPQPADPLGCAHGLTRGRGPYLQPPERLRFQLSDADYGLRDPGATPVPGRTFRLRSGAAGLPR